MQKDRGWTVGSKLKKFGGLSVKNWGWVEFLLNWMERGLI